MSCISQKKRVNNQKPISLGRVSSIAPSPSLLTCTQMLHLQYSRPSTHHYWPRTWSIPVPRVWLRTSRKLKWFNHKGWEGDWILQFLDMVSISGILWHLVNVVYKKNRCRFANNKLAGILLNMIFENCLCPFYLFCFVLEIQHLLKKFFLV